MISHIFNIKIKQPVEKSLDQQFDRLEELFDVEMDMIEEESKQKKKFQSIPLNLTLAKSLF
jgi:hypothetical protein